MKSKNNELREEVATWIMEKVVGGILQGMVVLFIFFGPVIVGLMS